MKIKNFNHKITLAQHELLKYFTSNPLDVRDHIIEALQQLATHDGDRNKSPNPFNDDIYTMFEILKRQIAIIDEEIATSNNLILKSS